MRLPVLSALMLALGLAACGFSPVYGDHAHSAPVAAEMNEVAIDNIPDRSGQILRNDLIDRMYGQGRPLQPRYTLDVKLRISTEDVGIRADATAARSLMNTYADYTLSDEKGKPLLKGTAHSVTSYNQLNNQYGMVVSAESASARTINEVGAQIVNRLSLYFAERASTDTAPTNLETPPPTP